MTLSRFMIEATRGHEDHADLESLDNSIQLARKTISNLAHRIGVNELTGNALLDKCNIDDNTMTSQSNCGKTLYEQAKKVLKNSLKFTGKIGQVYSKEDDQTILFEESWNSPYVAVFDPLDGASNIDVGIVTGTIFGIWKEGEPCLVDFGEDISESAQKCLLKNLVPGKNLVAAGYCMYSSSTVFMFSMGNGVHGFTLDTNIGEFVLTHPNVRVPKRGRNYSFNEANYFKWGSKFRQYVDNIKLGKGELGLSYTARYIGSLVGDCHRTLLSGGIFGYPADSKRPEGKLRLLHEVSPIAFLFEQAGGKSSTGKGSLLNVTPTSINQHVSTLLGSYDDVTEAEKYGTDQ
jgi:fructose-1,6-bisphosphatase I